MLTYTFDPALIELEETSNVNDKEFRLRLLQATACKEAMRRVQEHFQDNAVIIDVLFYTYPNDTYRIIVRQDYYAEFITELLKHRLLQSAAWAD